MLLEGMWRRWSVRGTAANCAAHFGRAFAEPCWPAIVVADAKADSQETSELSGKIARQWPVR